MNRKPSRARQLLVGAALVLGTGAGAAGIASAATASDSASSTQQPAASSSAQPTPPSGRSAGAATPQLDANRTALPDPASLPNGPGETALTGDDLAKATAAAEGAVSGATVVRAETDSSGDATYEVHMKKADGSFTTVELDSSFVVTKTIDGFGPGPKGAPAPQGPGAAPAQSN